jgi:hypothetical protein
MSKNEMWLGSDGMKNKRKKWKVESGKWKAEN